MKNIFKSFPICFAFILFFGCGSNNDNDRLPDSLSVKAAIDQNCITTINFVDLNDNVYAYRADVFFGVPSIQAGGHSTADESTDLGANIFIDLESVLNPNQNYTITESYGAAGTAYVFYIINGIEYISTNNNPSGLNVSQLEFLEDGTVKKIRFTFNNIEVVNNMDSNDLLCINVFELIFNL